MHRHNRKYTEEERIIIRSEIGITPMPVIAARLGRSVLAIRNAAGVEGLYPETIAKRSAGLSFIDVCRCLGIDRKSLFLHIRRGRIATKKIHTASHAGRQRYVYTFTYDAVERFLRDGGALYLMRPIAGWKDIYEEARGALEVRCITRQRLMQTLHISDGALHRWQVDKGFPAPFCSGEERRTYYDRMAVRAWLDAHPHYWTTAAREELCS